MHPSLNACASKRKQKGRPLWERPLIFSGLGDQAAAAAFALATEAIVFKICEAIW